MDECKFVDKIWKEGERTFRNYAIFKGRLDLTITNWAHQPYNNMLLNKIWELFPGLVVWELWIERNNKNFNNRSRSEEDV